MLHLKRSVHAILVASLVLCSQFVSSRGQAVEGSDSANQGLEAPDALFDQIDTNHDHVIDHDEYHNGWALLKAAALDGSSGGDSFFSNFSLLPKYKGGFWKGFTSGVAMILATEIGDKTFFIAAVLSMSHARSAVFFGAVSSLYVMTVLSSMMGLVLPNFLPPQYTHIFGGLLFLYFGCKLLYDSKSLKTHQVSEELEEVEEELLNTKKDDDEEGQQRSADSDLRRSKRKTFSQIVMQSFTLTFLAEWGDRSQIATIALAAAKDPYGVTLGGCIGHTLCTGLAVLGGRMLAARISEKTVSLGGGVIFIVFGIHSLFFEV